MDKLALTPTAALTAITALIAVYIAWQQWRTARHKLAIDLFDRRLRTYRDLNDAIANRHNEILALTFDQVTSDPPTQALTALWTAKSDAYFLFGKDVHQAIEKVEDRLGLLLEAKAEFTTNPDSQPPDYVKVIRFSANVFGAQDRLLEAVRPYMMMGAVSVARSFRWKRRERLGAGSEHVTRDQTAELMTNLAFGVEQGAKREDSLVTPNHLSSRSPA